MSIELPKLPFMPEDLAPYISAETIEYHYGKHHRTYVDKLNALITDNEYKNLDLEQIVAKSKDNNQAIFNNAAQVWNHNFYWNCLTKSSESDINKYENINKSIVKNFGSVEAFKEEFNKVAISTFGSGWAWLVKNSNDELKIISTSNAETPLTDNSVTPLMTCDVWEHAYYIDYRNARPKYLDAFWSLVNWNFVASNLNA